MKTKPISWIITLAVLVVSFVLGACILVTPAAAADVSGFSAQNAASYLKVISQEPHSVFDAKAHETVRQYLKDTLTGFGLTVEEHDWAKEELDFMGDLTAEGTLDNTKPIPYDIRNLWVTIPGKSETGMLLMAHYDSRGHASRDGEEGGSYGAADDGFGVVTLLELARLFAQVPQSELETSLYFCFTDAEETGMYGSYLESVENETVRDHVNFVMNVEARGVKGPAFMFETSKNNRKIMDLYQKANLPVTYSIATAVYSVMTNFTDFTSMLDIGKAGVNFSTLDNIDYYHVPADNYSNISVSSIQHYGEQILPMIRTYTSDAAYADMNCFVDDQDSVFFSLLPGVLARYSEVTAVVFTLVGVALYLVALVLGLRSKKIRGKQLLLAFLLLLGAMAGAAVIGFGISYAAALINGKTWNLTYLRVPGAIVLFAVSLLIVFALELLFCLKQFRKEGSCAREFLAAATGWNFLFALLTTFALSGASFLFFWPALFGALALLVSAWTDHAVIGHILYSLVNAVTLLIYVPLLYALYLAVTAGGLLALNLLLAFALSMVLPTVFLQGGLLGKSHRA